MRPGRVNREPDFPLDDGGGGKVRTVHIKSVPPKYGSCFGNNFLEIDNTATCPD